MSHSDAEMLAAGGAALRPEVGAFAVAMEARLRVHDADRGNGWRGDAAQDLLLCAQAKAVAAELYLEDPRTVDKLLVDAANYLMMVREVVRVRTAVAVEEGAPCR